MKLTNIGELRSLIFENEGEIKIGKLSFSYETGKDIDIRFDGELLEWIDEFIGDGVKFIGDDYFSVSSDIENGRKAKTEVKELREQLEAEKNKSKEASLAEGKVAAYEKLLIGRTVNLGN